MGKRARLSRIIKVFTYFGVLSLIPLLIYSAYIYFSLPEIRPKACITTTMYQVRLCPGSPTYQRYSQISKSLIDALILSEDGSFFSHKGFDWYEIKESFKENWKQGRIVRGGSTITQQLAKNVYLGKEKTLSRKIREYFIANQLETALSKSQILERYLNVVEFGKSLYGVKAASQHYFRKTPAQLSFLESVFLVSLLPNPKAYSKGFQNKKLTGSNIFRMKIILRRFFRYKKMNQALYTHYLNLVENMDWPFGNRFDTVPSVFSELEDEIRSIESPDSQSPIATDDMESEDEDTTPMGQAQSSEHEGIDPGTWNNDDEAAPEAPTDKKPKVMDDDFGTQTETDGATDVDDRGDDFI